MHKWPAQDSALSAKQKELIALDMGITVRCDGCIACHVHDALKADAAWAEILGTVDVAIHQDGGPAAVRAERTRLSRS